MSELWEVLKQALKISGLVLVMMVLVDLFNVRTQGQLRTLIRGGIWRQYWGAALLGAIPGCLGSFAVVSLYVHGMLSFGALVGCMVATCGDEALVMLSLFPRPALVLFGLLFIGGVALAWIADRLVSLLKFQPCEECRLGEIHVGEKGARHYFLEHVWSHLLREHLWRVFLWTFFALAVAHWGVQIWNLEEVVRAHPGWMLLLAALVGILPESGPHLIFATLFAQGLIPFSVLLTSSLVQDGHGLLPLLSYTWRDALLVKFFNFLFGLGTGLALYALGW